MRATDTSCDPPGSYVHTCREANRGESSEVIEGGQDMMGIAIRAGEVLHPRPWMRVGRFRGVR